MRIEHIGKELAWQLRHEVMWPDRHPDAVKLADDETGRHFGLFAEAGLVSVVSLFTAGEEAQFRKFATRQTEQGKGYGSALLAHVLEEAAKAGAKRIFCNARTEKTGFYEKFGLLRTETAFVKDGKSYVVMEKFFAQGRSGSGDDQTAVL